MSTTAEWGAYNIDWALAEVEGLPWQLGVEWQLEEWGLWYRRRYRFVNSQTGKWITPWLTKRDLTLWMHGLCIGALAERAKTEVSP